MVAKENVEFLESFPLVIGSQANLKSLQYQGIFQTLFLFCKFFGL